MGITGKLRLVLDSQKEQADAFERALAEIEQIDFVGQNAVLKEDLAAARQQVSQLEEQCEKLRDEVSGLNAAMFRHAYAERGTYARATRDKLNIYFGASEKWEMDRLSAYEKQCQDRMSHLRAQISADIDRYFPDLLQHCSAMEQSLNNAVAQMRQNIQAAHASSRADADAAFAQMEAQPLTPEQVAAAAQKDNLERTVGTKVINIAGLVMILFGVVFGTQYVYTNILQANELKGALIYLLGALLLLGGELLSRHWRSFFATGVTALGVAILFAATALSHFSLGILGMVPAVLMCVAVAAVSFLLSLRYNSQVIAAMSLAGGYLPILAVSGSDRTITYVLGYFVVLNVFALLVSAKKNWLVLRFLSFGFNTIATLYFILESWGSRSVQPFLLGYLIVAFGMYLCLAIIHPLVQRVKVPANAIVLAALNTVIYCPLMYLVLDNMDLGHLNGLLAVLICAVYFVFAKLVEKRVQNGARGAVLFYLTAFVFAVLAVPIQLGLYWTSLGWMVLGTALAVFGILKNERIYARAGYIIFSLCVAAFLFLDVLNDWSLSGAELVWRYGAVTVGAAVILTAILFRRRDDVVYWRSTGSGGARVFQGAVIVNTWLYLSYLGMYLVNQVWYDSLAYSWISYFALTFSAVTLGYATVAGRIPCLRSRATNIIFMVLRCIGFLTAVGANAVRYAGGALSGQSTASTIILVVFDALVLLAMWDFARTLYVQKKLSFVWVPLAVSVFGLILLTQILVVQFHLEVTSMVISLIYMAAAFAFVFYGFFRRSAMLRRFGLTVAILSVVKLFLIDLSYLRSIERIISYFAFGVVLIAISYVYQLFSRQLEVQLKAEGSSPPGSEPTEDGDETNA